MLDNHGKSSRADDISVFPVKVTLPSDNGSLMFEAFSPVEYFRIAQYGGENEFLEKFSKALLVDDVVFDIGASVGLMTVYAATYAAKGRVVAFEPDPETTKRLRWNVDLNSLSNVDYITWAVSDSIGEAELFTDGACGFAPSLRRQNNRAGAPQTGIKVPTGTIDAAIIRGDLPLPTVIKIDIEGAEFLCLKGATKLLKGGFAKSPRLIFLELHPEFLRYFNSSVDDVHNLLSTCGYNVLWVQTRDDQIHYCYSKQIVFRNNEKP